MLQAHYKRQKRVKSDLSQSLITAFTVAVEIVICYTLVHQQSLQRPALFVTHEKTERYCNNKRNCNYTNS